MTECWHPILLLVSLMSWSQGIVMQEVRAYVSLLRMLMYLGQLHKAVSPILHYLANAFVQTYYSNHTNALLKSWWSQFLSVSTCVYSVCEGASFRACSPDSAVACCNPFGGFLSTAISCFTLRPGLKTQIVPGYCNRGGCATHVCGSMHDGVLLDEFCGSSSINPCKAACSSSLSANCYDTALFMDGGETLEDGAICLKDDQNGAFSWTV